MALPPILRSIPTLRLLHRRKAFHTPSLHRHPLQLLPRLATPFTATVLLPFPLSPKYLVRLLLLRALSTQELHLPFAQSGPRLSALFSLSCLFKSVTLICTILHSFVSNVVSILYHYFHHITRIRKFHDLTGKKLLKL